MGILNIEEIKRDAACRMELVQKTEELQALVSRMYPGCRVVLLQEGEPEPHRLRRTSFESMGGSQQIMTVLVELGKPVELQVIHAEMVKRGSGMSMETMMSILSRGKDELFVNVARGVWAASPEFYAHRHR